MQTTHMRTHTGEPIIYAEPEATTIYPMDLYRALSRTCRYGGHLEWSVLQHLGLCVQIAEGLQYSTRSTAYVAAHDFAEAYVGDIPAGLKQCLPAYREIEARWEAHTHPSIGLLWPPSEELEDLIKRVDYRALAVEMACLGWGDWPPAVRTVDATGGDIWPSERMAFRAICELEPLEIWDHVWDAVVAGRWGD